MTWDVPKSSTTASWTCLKNSLLSGIPAAQIPYYSVPPPFPAVASLNLTYSKTTHFYGVIPFVNGAMVASLQTVPAVAATPNGVNLLGSGDICILSNGATSRINPFTVDRLIFGVWDTTTNLLVEWCDRTMAGSAWCHFYGKNLVVDGHTLAVAQYSIMSAVELTQESHPYMSLVKQYRYTGLRATPAITGSLRESKVIDWSGLSMVYPRPADVMIKMRDFPDITNPSIAGTSSHANAWSSLTYSDWKSLAFKNAYYPDSSVMGSRFVNYPDQAAMLEDAYLETYPITWMMSHLSQIDLDAILTPCGY